MGFPRKTKRKFCFESVPIIVLFFLGVVFFSVLALSIVQGYFSPNPYTVIQKTTKYANDEEFFNKSFALTQEIQGLTTRNQELRLVMSVIPKIALLNQTDFSKTINFERVTIMASMDQKKWITISTNAKPIQKKIECKKSSSINIDGMNACEEVSIFHEPILRYKNYKVEIFLKDETKAMNKIFENKFGFKFVYINKEFTAMELITRYIYIGIALVCVTIYIFFCLFLLRWKDWNVEHFWTIVLFIGLIFYNNPLYFFHFVELFEEGAFVLPALGTLFQASFFCIFFFFILVLMHNSYYQEKKTINFYFPKFVMCGVIWLFVCIVLGYSTYLKSDDLSYSIVDYSFFELLTVVFFCLLSIYCFMFCYYMTRAISFISKAKNKRKRLLYSFLFFIMIISICVFVFIETFGLLNNSIFWTSFQFLWNGFVISMGIFLLPAKKYFPNDQAFKAIRSDDHLNDGFKQLRDEGSVNSDFE